MPLPPETKPLSVSALTNRIKLRLEEHFPESWVVGEVTNLARPVSGHIYFSLKDAKAVLRCVMWRSFALRLKFDLRDGMEVIVRGGVTVYEPRGDYQLQATEIIPKGIGANELALQQLKEKLFRKGYFKPERKRPLPQYPRSVALITSPTGAAIRDMLEILAKRWPLAEVLVCPTKVQGEEAGLQVASALRLVNQLHQKKHLKLDAVVIGRGGGSSEDLAAFNEEIVADAIFESEIPVVSAVGHEIDVSIADLVADYRALTPSQAITALCPDREVLQDDLISRFDRLQDAMSGRLLLARQKLQQIVERPAFRKPAERIHVLEQRLDEITERLNRSAKAHLTRSQDKLSALSERLEGLSPLNILARGYSLTRKVDSVNLIRHPESLLPGDRIITRVVGGEFTSVVETVHTAQAKSPQE